ncbi:MAG: efflux RND transporter periplasmic adaptor subunit [Acidobacteriia bacterium]|nr:efflux RND transporter periplasmic adaptor subunit [Terriglobia bacterium]
MRQALDFVLARWVRSRRDRVLIACGGAGIVLGVCWLVYTAVWGGARTEYYTSRVERGDIVQIVSATGTINAVTTVQVGSQVSGNIKRLYVDFNSKVKQGQLIAEIDPAIFQAQLQQAEADQANAEASVQSLAAQIETQRADLLSAKADIDKAQAQANDAQLQYERAKGLADQGIVAISQRDTAKATTDSAQASLHSAQAMLEQSKAKLNVSIANLEQAKAQVKQRKAAVDLGRLNLLHTHIYAPIDGTVIARNVDQGQTVAASLQAPTLFVIAQDLTKMLVYAKTDEADVGRIQAGATATFRVDSFPREIFSGKVMQIRMNATTVQNVVTYDTVVAFDNAGQRLFPGMTAYVSIPVAWENDAVKIPNGALRYKPEMKEAERLALLAKYGIAEAGRTANKKEPKKESAGMRTGTNGGPPSGSGGSSVREDFALVWKVRADKSLEPVRVKIGVTDFTFTAMKEGALKEGDELVIGESSKGARAGQQQSPVGGAGGGMPRRM